jgi:hypothetical protein
MRTAATLEALVRALQTNCGDMYDACRQACVSPVFVKAWVKDDQDVAEQLAEAERVGALQIESEAIRRAVRGHDEPVYFKGAEVGSRKVYSDGLMQTLLKGRLRERYGADGEGGGITVNGQAQINIMPRANSYDEWLRMRDSTMALRDKEKLLPSPDQTIEAIGVPVSPLEGLGL